MSINNILMDDFTNGELNRGQCRFDFPDKAIADGLNLELVDGGFKVRPGTSIATQSGLPVGEVMSLVQVRFPTNEVSYLVAQVKKTSDGSIALYACPDPLPTGGA